jgi:hypothetical protein
VFLIEDESHAEPQEGEFPTLRAAINELERRATIPWDQPPNLAPCTGWRTCGRDYQVIEYDTSTTPWRELRRMPFLRVSAKGIEWLGAHGSSANGPAA